MTQTVAVPSKTPPRPTLNCSVHDDVKRRPPWV